MARDTAGQHGEVSDPMNDDVGTRVRRWRVRRGLTQKALAELAGFTQGYIGQIETGVARLEKLKSQTAIAAALQISVAELIGQRGTNITSRPTGIEFNVELLRQSLIHLAMPIADLHVMEEPDATHCPTTICYASIGSLFHACRYDVLMPTLANAMDDLVSGHNEPGSSISRGNLRNLVYVCFRAASTCVILGYHDLALVAAEQCRRLAGKLEDPVISTMANWVFYKIAPSGPATARLLDSGIVDLSPHVGTDVLAAQTFGIHHLAAAHVTAANGDTLGTKDHLREAQRLAAHTGESPLEPWAFGPANVATWTLGVLTMLGEGPQALVSAKIRPESIQSANRRAYYHMHLARALLQTRSHDSDAALALQRAETIAPQLVRLTPEAHSALRTLLSRPRAGSNRDLYRLTERIGLAY
jgi:transcriptional regulator with XRE-family HTH domain